MLKYYFLSSDSPLPSHRPPSQLPTPGKSPLLSSRHKAEDDSETSHPAPQGSFSYVTSTHTQSPEHSSHDITSSSADEGQRSDLSSPVSDMSNYPPDEQNSITHVREKLQFAENITQTVCSFAATALMLGSASQNASSEALHSPSTTSLHSGSVYSPQSRTSVTSLSGTPQARHSRSQSLLSDNYHQLNTYSSGNRRSSAGSKLRDHQPTDDMEPTLKDSRSETPQASVSPDQTMWGRTPQTKAEEEASDGSS